jgi:hypothetical protein
MTQLKTSLLTAFSLFLLIAVPYQAEAAKKKGGKGAFAGGTLSAGLGLGLTTADQSGLNTMISTTKTAVASSTSNFSSGLEFMGHITFKFSNNLVAVQFRPTYFQQSTSGSGTDGSHSYDLTGFTLFPLVRLIPLSNDIIDFYMQLGIGYGKLDGSITNGTRKVSFSGSNFGMQAGIGADFCLLADHCFGVEGNYRYLPMERNIVSSASGALPYGTSQAAKDRELEDLNGSDIGTSMTGISGMLTYSYNF